MADSTQALPEMIAGQLHYMIERIASATPLAQSGKLKPMTVLSAKRYPLLPQVPAIAEAGVSSSEASPWFGIAGPKGLDPVAPERLSCEISSVLHERDVKKAALDMYTIPTSMPTDVFSDLIHREITYWTEASIVVGVRPK